MEHFLEAFYALFPSRQGKLCCHTCYRSTRFWNVIGAKSGECSKCSARKRRTPRSLRSSVIQDRQRNEFIRSFIAIFIASKTEIGYVNLNRYTIVWNSGRGNTLNGWLRSPISFESRVARFHGSLLIVSHDGN